MPTHTFSQLALARATTTAHPDGSGDPHTFDDAAGLGACLDHALDRAATVDVAALADLAARLDAAAAPFSHDAPDEQRAALPALATGFADLLRLLATLRFADDVELLAGNDQHQGFHATALAGLLRGQPDLKDGGSHTRTRRIVGAGDPAPVRDARYQWTLAEALPEADFAALDDAGVQAHADGLFAACLFAVDDNRDVLTAAMDPEPERLDRLIDALRVDGRTVTLGLSSEPTGQERKKKKGARPPRNTNDLRQLCKRDKGLSCVLLGQPGSGRTRALTQLALHCAEQRRAGGRTRLPVYLSLARTLDETPLVDRLRAASGLDGGAFSTAAKQGDLLLLIDGLDEAPAGRFRALAGEIDELVKAHGRCGLVVSGRDAGPTVRTRLPHFHLDGLTDGQLRDALTAALGTAEAGGAAFETLAACPPLQTLCRRPGWLAMLTDARDGAIEAPASAAALVGDWVARRLAAADLGDVPADALTTALAGVARRMRADGRSAVSTEHALGWIGESAPDLAPAAALDAARAAGLVSDDDGVLTFAGAPLADWLAARALESLPDTRDRRWHGALLMFADLQDDPTETVRALAEANLPLAAAWASRAFSPSAELEDAIVSGAAAALDGDSDGRRNDALRALALVWNDAARALVAARRGAKEVDAFLRRYCRPRDRAAIELLAARATPATIGGAARALGGPPSDAGLRAQLGQALARVLAEQPEQIAEHKGAMKDLITLAEWATLDEAQRDPAARALARMVHGAHGEQLARLGEVAGHLGLAGHPELAAELARAAMRSGADVDADALAAVPADVRQELCARLLLAGQLERLGECAAALDDRGWLAPFADALIEQAFDRRDPVGAVALLTSIYGDEVDRHLARALMRMALPPRALDTVLPRLPEIDNGQVLGSYVLASLDAGRPSSAARLLLAHPDLPDAKALADRAAHACLRSGKRTVALNLVVTFELEGHDDALARLVSDLESGKLGPSSKHWSSWTGLVFGGLWSRLPEPVREQLVQAALARPDLGAVKDWDPGAVEQAGKALLDRLRSGTWDKLQRGMAKAYGVADSVRDAALEGLRGQLDGGEVGGLIGRLRDWGIAREDVPELDGALGQLDPAELGKAFRNGMASEEAVGARLDELLAAGDSAGAMTLVSAGKLGIDFRPRLVGAIREALDGGRHADAGRLIATLELAGDFGGELKDVIAALVAEGDWDTAGGLARSLSSDDAGWYGEQLSAALTTALEIGDYAAARRVVGAAGRERKALAPAVAAHAASTDDLTPLFDRPNGGLLKLLDRDAVDAAVGGGGLVRCVVSMVREAWMQLVVQTPKGMPKLRLFCHRNVAPALFDEAAVGQVVYARARPRPEGEDRKHALPSAFELRREPDAEPEASAERRPPRGGGRGRGDRGRGRGDRDRGYGGRGDRDRGYGGGGRREPEPEPIPEPPRPKPLGKGQSRKGIIRRDGGRTFVYFDDIEREAQLDKPDMVSEIADGSAATFYVLSANKREAKVRFESAEEAS